MSVIQASDQLQDIKKIALHLLNRAGNDKHSSFRFIVFNTMAKGFPNSRYVVLRKYAIDTNELVLFTDSRSNKIREIEENHAVSVLSYDKQKKFQLKIFGNATIHHQDELSQQYWDGLQAGKESYNTSFPPGSQVDNVKKAQKMRNSFDNKNFAVIVMKVSHIECLQLSPEGHIRAFFDLKKNTASFLVP